MGITIKELSELSGYSSSTISRVIANKGNVKKETADKIKQLLLEYDYRPNIMELRLSMEKEKRIMVIVSDLHNWYYAEIICKIKKELEEKDCIPVICYSENNLEYQRRYLQMAYEDGYLGVIFMDVVDPQELYGSLEKEKCPIVMVNRYPKWIDMDTICGDNYRGGYIATEYLIEMGHKKIACLAGITSSSTTFERMRGYEEAMRNAHLSVTQNNLFYGDLKQESGYKFGENLIKKMLGLYGSLLRKRPDGAWSPGCYA